MREVGLLVGSTVAGLHNYLNFLSIKHDNSLIGTIFVIKRNNINYYTTTVVVTTISISINIAEV
jgi:hypothetical protein